MGTRLALFCIMHGKMVTQSATDLTCIIKESPFSIEGKIYTYDTILLPKNYSKPCVKRTLKKRQSKDLNYNW